jgi:uncharacterized protein YjbJ (UPF0337 family)
MTWNEIETHWPQFAPLVRRHWFRLTETDLAEIDGRRDLLVWRIAHRYDLPQEHAEREVDAWAWLVKSPPGVVHEPGISLPPARQLEVHEPGISLPPARQLGVLHRILEVAGVT